MARRGNMHTVFHQMEEKGYFEKNPANQDARDQVTGQSLYKGPVQYPKMFYHPQGAERITVPAEIVATLMGPQRVGEQREIIWQIAQTEAEGDALRAQGWWDHPGKAIKARLQRENPGQEVSGPDLGPEAKIQELQAQIAKMQAEANDMTAKQLAQSRATGATVGVAQPRPPVVVPVQEQE